MIITFWRWLFTGAPQSKAGWRLLLNWWMFLHLGVALFLTFALPVSPYDFATKALFPAASILVGMAIAWTSRAATVLDDIRFREAVVSDEQPLEDYVYGYQLSLLIMVAMVVVVALVANGGFKLPITGEFASRSTSLIMYSLMSLSIRECWTVINFSNLLAILHSRIPTSTSTKPRRK